MLKHAYTFPDLAKIIAVSVFFVLNKLYRQFPLSALFILFYFYFKFYIMSK